MATNLPEGVTLGGPLPNGSGTSYEVFAHGHQVGVVVSRTVSMHTSVGSGHRLTRKTGTATRWSYGLDERTVCRAFYKTRRDAVEALMSASEQEG